MQLKLYRYLTWGSLVMALLLVAGAAYIFINHESITNFSNVMILYVVLAFILTMVYKFLENNLDKLMLQHKAFKGEVVLANIKSSEIITGFRDSGFRTYLLTRFEVTYYDDQMQPHNASIVEKMNQYCKNVPCGSVYMTYDSKNPNNGLFVQNVIISRIPELMPLVQKYEKTKYIDIKYLDCHYDKGLVIQTFKDALGNTNESEEISE